MEKLARTFRYNGLGQGKCFTGRLGILNSQCMYNQNAREKHLAGNYMPQLKQSESHQQTLTAIFNYKDGLSGINKSLSNLNRTQNAYSNLCSQCINKQSRYSNPKYTNQSLRVLKREFSAFSKLLSKSGYNNPNDLMKLCQSAGAMRWFSTSNNVKQHDQRHNDKEKDPDKEQEEDPDEKMPLVARMMLVFWLSFLIFVILRLQSGEDTSVYKFVTWNEFVHEMLAKGEVEEVIVRPEAELVFIKLYPGAVIRGKISETDTYTMKILDADKFEDKVRKTEADIGIKPERGIPVSYQRESSWAPVIVMTIVALAAFAIFRSMVKIQLPNPTDLFASERKAKFVRADLLTPQGKGISFKDVAGLHEAKVEVMEFVDYLKQPERYKALGGRIPRGALLLGPPGCGKTLLAKAVATEAKVPFLAMAGSEFVEMLGGLGAARVRDLFKEAREKAPCIIYVDEIDAIGRRRSGDNWQENTEEEHTLNQLLVEMDGMDTVEGVIMLASTNRAEVLDKALLRPGRFDRHIMIDFPTLAERKEIFDMYLAKLKILRPPQAYSERLAQLSPGMSGADIANVCNEAALHAARDQKTRIDTADFDYAVERVIAGVAKKTRVLTPQEKKVVAYHEAGHALIGWLLEHTDNLLKVSIVPRTSSALGFAQYTPQDKKLFSKEELFQKMCLMLGGRVAESITFNSVTTGAQDDLKKVGKLAYEQVRSLGMSDTIGQVSFPVDDSNKFAGKPYSKRTARMIDEEARILVERAYRHTEALLLENKEKLRVIAEALLEKECLNYNDMEQLVGPPKYASKKVPTAKW